MTTKSRGPLRILALLAVAALVALAGCGSSDDDKSSSGSSGSTAADSGAKDVKGSISIVGIWVAQEQKNFQRVIDAFNKKYPNVKVKYNPAGDNTPTVLSTALSGGRPPDLASVGQPGLVKQFQKQGKLKDLEFARQDIESNFQPDVVKLGTIGGKIYSIIPKGANKSTVWYNVEAFKNAGVEPPKTYDELITAAKTLKASGTPAYSLAGGDGWTLTDLFENIYIRQAGPDKYDQLSTHDLKWTDTSVKDALTEMAKIYSDTSNIVGGTSGALQTDFPTSVSKVFVNPPKAAMNIEGDFVPGVVAGKTKLKPETGYNVFDFPSVGGSEPTVVGGGDSLIMFKDSPAAEAFVKFMASADAGKTWVAKGGVSSPNKNVPADAYPDPITRETATKLAQAKTFRFDMSDLAPASFGGTPGQGEWKILADFLKNPKDVDGTASALEKAAAKAFK
jgi:ABC-type glycerol-3-phosphate transport system substrate-binding protein